jgi:hypothetical protein
LIGWSALAVTATIFVKESAFDQEEKENQAIAVLFCNKFWIMHQWLAL